MISHHEKRRTNRIAPGRFAFPLGFLGLYLRRAFGQGVISPYQLGCHFP
jgi:hypothetical protein